MFSECDVSSILNLVKILFDKLDYHSSKDSLQDWKALADSLDVCFHDNVYGKDIANKLKEYWDERSDWWPGYHFGDSIVKTSLSSHDNDVVLEKARVAKLLLDEGGYLKKKKKKFKVLSSIWE